MKNRYRVIRDNGKITVKFETSMKKKYRFIKEFGKVMINLGLLTFTSLVLGSIIKGDYERLSLIRISGCVTVLAIVVGIIMLMAGGE
jgi:archaellum component FlaG (FlaF/FlaG flagellin family)